MKVIVTGKGGAGKTTIAALLARSFARAGVPVLAVDADPNPNLALTLGLEADAVAELEGIVNAVLRHKAAHQHEHDGRHACDPPVQKSAGELVEELAVTGPDGVRLVQTGLIERPADGCLCCGSHGTTRRVLAELGTDGRIVVADLEAGLNDLIWAYPRPDDIVLVVTAPYLKSLEVARRALAITREVGVGRRLVVVNRAESEKDVDDVRIELGADAVAVPDDPAVRSADRQGLAAFDAAPGTPAVTAISALAGRLLPAGYQMRSTG